MSCSFLAIALRTQTRAFTDMNRVTLLVAKPASTLALPVVNSIVRDRDVAVLVLAQQAPSLAGMLVIDEHAAWSSIPLVVGVHDNFIMIVFEQQCDRSVTT